MNDSRSERIEKLSELLEAMPIQFPSDSIDDFPEHELTLTQFKAMTFLQQGPLRMGDIAKLLNMSLSSVTNLVNRLETKGLVERAHDTNDRRVVTCALTDEGREAVSWIWQLGRRRMLTLASVLDDQELNQVIEAFELLRQAAVRVSSQEQPDD
jgi:DNA-binding MarR family transcriptional regulator